MARLIIGIGGGRHHGIGTPPGRGVLHGAGVAIILPIDLTILLCDRLTIIIAPAATNRLDLLPDGATVLTVR